MTPLFQRQSVFLAVSGPLRETGVFAISVLCFYTDTVFFDFIRFSISCFFIQYVGVSFLFKLANFNTIIEAVFVEAVLTLLGLHKRIHPPSSDASKLR